MSVELIDLQDVLGRSPGYSYAAVASGGTHVYTAGAVPVDPEGILISPGDLEQQTQAVVRNLKYVLDATGVKPDAIVKSTIYVVGERPIYRACGACSRNGSRRRTEHAGRRCPPRLPRAVSRDRSHRGSCGIASCGHGHVDGAADS